MGATGGCQCGRIRYEVSGEPNQSDICECRMCQRSSGALAMASAQFDADKVRWTRGEPKLFRSSSVADQGFCPDCGTSLTYQSLRKGTISITLASLDDPETFRPRNHTGIEGRASWFAEAINAAGQTTPPLPEGTAIFQYQPQGQKP